MENMSQLSKTILACLLQTAASSALAQKAGDNIISAGYASIHTSTSLGALNSPVFAAALTDATAKISSTPVVSLSWSHMHTDHIATEVAVGIPPQFTVDLYAPYAAALGGPNFPGAASARAVTPTALAKYLFNAPSDKFRPFVGLGISYASFQLVKTNPALPAIGALAGTSAKFSASWAPVYNAGLIYNIDERWSISGAATYMPVKTTAAFVASPAYGSGTTRMDIKINPTIYSLSLGYRF